MNKREAFWYSGTYPEIFEKIPNITLSLTCPLISPLFLSKNPKYINSFTSSILSPFHTHSFSSLYLLCLLKTITFDLSAFNVSFLSSKYFSNHLIIMLLSTSSSLAITTMSYAYSNVQKRLPPTAIPPSNPLLNSSSISAMNTANSSRLSGHLFLNPNSVQNSSYTFLSFVSLYISLTLSIKLFFIPLSVITSYNFPLFTDGNAASKSMKNAHTFPFFCFPFFSTTCCSVYMLKIII